MTKARAFASKTGGYRSHGRACARLGYTYKLENGIVKLSFGILFLLFKVNFFGAHGHDAKLQNPRRYLAFASGQFPTNAKVKKPKDLFHGPTTVVLFRNTRLVDFKSGYL